jgi:hypothetical protein
MPCHIVISFTCCLHWLVYSCCSHLEHRASVKRFVSLQFINLRHSVGLLGRVISPRQGRYVTQTQNKHKQTSMPLVGIQPTIPAFERTETCHILTARPLWTADLQALWIISRIMEFVQSLITFILTCKWPPLWSSGQNFWLQIQRYRVRFPALPDFLRSRGSGTGYTQPREDNWGATWMKK